MIRNNLNQLQFLTIMKKIIIVHVVDFFLLYGALALAIITQPLRWYEPVPNDYWLYFTIAPVGIYCCHVSGHYRTVLQHLGYANIIATLKGLALCAVIWGFFSTFIDDFFGIQNIPNIVPVLFFAYACALLIGIRYLAKYLIYGGAIKKLNGRKPIAIHGTREAGIQLIHALRNHAELVPVAIISSSADRVGRELLGLRIYGMDDLAFVFQRYEIKELILTKGAITNEEKQKIFKAVTKFDVQLRTLPSLMDVASGKYIVDYIKNVDVVDLLGRSKVQANNDYMKEAVENQRVLVTGGGGSIGTELCHQIASLNPDCLVILEQSEFNLYSIEQSLRDKYKANIHFRLGSVNDKSRIEEIIKEFKITMIYHAAALKHVPIAEANPIETARVNIMGTYNLLSVAAEQNIKKFLLISTDKAVRPTNIMGATKRFAEILLQIFQSKYPHIIFTAVRFGNVLGTSGSVVPLFRSQLNKGGPLTITHRDVTRYFMAIEEAVELVIQAGQYAKGGEVFLLDMGEPVKIYDMAVNMIRLSGQSLKSVENPDGDIEIKITGLRPGEKLYEELLIDASSAEKTNHPKISMAKDAQIPLNYALESFENITQLIENGQGKKLRELLINISFYHNTPK